MANNFKNQYKKLPKSIRNNLAVKIIAVVIAIIYALDYYNLNPLEVKNLEGYNNTVTTINSGQGDSALIESNGDFLLIDAGGSEDENIMYHLNERDISKIDVLLITHFHQDHISAVLDILDEYTVEEIIIPNLSDDNIPTTNFFHEFLLATQNKNIPINIAKEDDEYIIGDGTLTILKDTVQNADDINDTSILSLFTLNDFTYLSTGDANSEVEDMLIGSKVKDVTILSAGHHGSSGSTSDEFLDYISPEFIVFSAGKDNSYGHPHSEVIEKIEDRFIPYKITFNEGNIVYSMEEKAILEK